MDFSNCPLVHKLLIDAGLNESQFDGEIVEGTLSYLIDTILASSNSQNAKQLIIDFYQSILKN